MIASLVGPGVLLAQGLLSAGKFMLSWFTWFMGDLNGIVVFAPALLIWRMPSPIVWSRRKVAEIILFALSFFLCGLLVFVLLKAPLLFLLLPFLIWLACRFFQKEVAFANVTLVAMAVAGALRAKEKQLEEAQRLAHMGSWEWAPVKDRLSVSNEMFRIYGIAGDNRRTLISAPPLPAAEFRAFVADEKVFAL